MTVNEQQQPGNSNGHQVTDRLMEEVQNLLGALADRGLAAARDTVGGAVERLTDYAEQGGGPGLMAAVTGAKSMSEGKSPVRSLFSAGMAGAKSKLGLGGGKGGKSGKGQKLKVTNIVESIDVGVPVRLAYNQWTQFTEFPTFMKKVENVEQAEDQKLNWKAQVFWSHRSWEATILQQVPDEQIIWQSKGDKGHVDGAVTFHEIGPRLTRILLVLQYHPQGFFEQTGNLWRAAGRRARLELKHYRRHVMSQVLLNPDELTGWRGVIKDGEVVQDHESRLREEQDAEQGDDEYRGQDEAAGENDEDYEDGYQDGDAEDGYEDGDTEDGYEEENGPAEDEYEDDDEDEDDQYADEDEDEDEDEDDEDAGYDDQEEDLDAAGEDEKARAGRGRRR